MRPEARDEAGVPEAGRRTPAEGTPPDEDASGGEPEAAGENAAEQVERDLDAMLAETRRERDEYLELAQRTRADFDNYRRRIAAEAEQASRRGKAELAGELIEVIDNLERALAAAESEAAEGDGALKQGMALTYRELQKKLAAAGVEVFDPVGERFDPAWHEAIQTRAQEQTEPGVILEVLQKGYRLDGQLIRPARVVVSE